MAFFQKIIERALGEVSFSIVIIIYVDNILVGSMDLETHIQELKLVIEALTRAGLRLKPSKCKVGYLVIQFMGAVVDGERRGVDPHKVQVFASMRKPRTGKEVQRVLGFLNFLRDFIPLYANIVGPLEKWRSARVISDGEWEKSGAREAFERAKKVLLNAPVLHNPDWSREFILETDASQFGVGAVLFQEVGGEKRYVDFAAKAFNKAQQNYGAAKRELLAGLFAMARWRPWLLYRRFTWGMDLKAMTFINLSTNRTVLDWINLFMEFDFVTKFKKGVLNVLPHELSHCYDLLELDFGRGEKLGDKGAGLLGKAVLVARGVGTGFDQSGFEKVFRCYDRGAEGQASEGGEGLGGRYLVNHLGEGERGGGGACKPGECQGEEQDLGRGLQGGGFGAEEDSQPAKQDGGTLGGAV